ncbi:transporter [Vibrio maerlii]|uniref:transporter n=1 Tax=Vibrio maerlii TaxID=2231648 RepID=UPI000E3C58B0|nr:transporter [Vibrio maerlii]
MAISHSIVPLTLCSLFIAPLYAEDDQPKRPQTVTDVNQRSGVLTPKGKVTFDASISYTQNSSNNVSVVGYTILPTLIVGLIEVSDADRTTITAGLTARYGLFDDTELEVRLPYVYRNDQISTRPIGQGAGDDDVVNTSEKGGGLGDIEFAIRHQFNFDTTPYWVGSLKFKSDTGRSPYDIDIDPSTREFDEVPTGSGFWSIEPGLSMIYPTDPAVLFANLGYTYNIKDTKSIGDTSAEIDLGDTISLGAGMGFALNPDLSFSFGISHRTILKSKTDGQTSDEAKVLQLDTINFGINYAYSETSSFNISAQAGLTEDTPDFQLTLRMPFAF